MTFFESKIERALKLLDGQAKETKIDLFGSDSLIHYSNPQLFFQLGHNSVVVDHERVSYDVAVALASALRSNTTIRQLDIRGNDYVLRY